MMQSKYVSILKNQKLLKMQSKYVRSHDFLRHTPELLSCFLFVLLEISMELEFKLVEM